jgi:hypothetical protein
MHENEVATIVLSSVRSSYKNVMTLAASYPDIFPSASKIGFDWLDTLPASRFAD